LVPGDEAGDEVGVTDIAVDEGVEGILGEGCEIFRVSGVGELVEINHGGSHRDCLKNEVRAYETCSPGDDDGLVGQCDFLSLPFVNRCAETSRQHLLPMRSCSAGTLREKPTRHFGHNLRVPTLG